MFAMKDIIDFLAVLIVAALSKGLCLVIVPGLVYANAESTMRV